MRDRELRRGESIGNVREFLDTWAPGHPRLADARKRYTRWAGEYAALRQEHHRAQTNRGDPTRLLRTQAAALRAAFLKPIAASGRKLLRNVPGAERALAVPRARAKPGEIADSALRMRRLLSPKAKRLFFEVGFERDFFARFNVAARALHDAVKGGSKAGRLALVSARANAVIREAREHVLVLDGVLAPLIAVNEGMAAAWAIARRVPKRLGRPKGKRGAATGASDSPAPAQPTER